MTSPESAEQLRTSRRHWVLATGILAVVGLVAGVVVTTTVSQASSSQQVISVTNRQCGDDWQVGQPGHQTFSVVNQGTEAAEVLLENGSGGVVAEIAVIGPGTTVEMPADLGNGTYTFTCYLPHGWVLTSPAVRVTGATTRSSSSGLKMITPDMLDYPNDAYEGYAAQQLSALAAAVATIQQDLVANNLTAARSDWLTAMTDWERVGASYDSFGKLGEAVDGLPDGLLGGVGDPHFTGLHRLEYGLWHGQSASALLPVAQTLSADVATVQQHLDSADLAGDPSNLPTRAHEILEDALRDHLSGIDDLGAGAEYPETAADLEATRAVLGDLAPLINPRAPHLLATADDQMNTLQAALTATQDNGQWQTPQQVPQAGREQVDAALGALLGTLSTVPDLLQAAGSGGS